MTVVLDSWAVLAYLDDMPGAADRIDELLGRERPLMSWMNAGEVAYVLERRFGADASEDAVRDLREVVDLRLPDEYLVLEAASIKASHAMSYADAFCAALARSVRGEVWTGDPELLVGNASWSWQDLRS